MLVLTAIGQIPIKGKNIEWRYHDAVNSHAFQKTFWILARPITWTGEKMQELYWEKFGQRQRRSTLAR